MDAGPKDVFLQSLRRCDARPRFLEIFYTRFLASSPAVRDKFLFTDFDRQRRMLRRSLDMIASATAGDPDGLRELSDRAETHGPRKLNIQPELYSLWTEALIATARESDEEWSDMVEAAWRTTLGIAITHILRHYQE